MGWYELCFIACPVFVWYFVVDIVWYRMYCILRILRILGARRCPVPGEPITTLPQRSPSSCHREGPPRYAGPEEPIAALPRKSLVARHARGAHRHTDLEEPVIEPRPKSPSFAVLEEPITTPCQWSPSACCA